MNLLINRETFKFLKESKLKLEEYIILFVKFYGLDWYTYGSYMPSSISYLRLQKEKYLDKNKILTDKGKKLFESSFSKEALDERIKQEELFEEWWEAYPTTDKHSTFPVTRRFKTNKIRTKYLYISLLNEGIEHNKMLSAVRNEVASKIKNSTPSNNELKYMQNPYTYLFNRTFESWVDEDPVEFNEYGKDIS